jgi:hypothetical protein
MGEQHGFIAAWHPEANIPYFVEQSESLLAKLPFALITCVDSNPEPALTSKIHDEFASARVDYQQIGPYFFTPTVTVPRLIDSLLTGFDEVWFLSAVPESATAAPLRLTSESPITDQWPLPNDLARKLKEWLDRNHAILGVGDGVGLNTLTTDPEIAREIDSALIEP